jgi:hypothetical protein
MGVIHENTRPFIDSGGFGNRVCRRHFWVGQDDHSKMACHFSADDFQCHRIVEENLAVAIRPLA